MLVLSRQRDESIMIGDTIKVKILDVRDVRRERRNTNTREYVVRLGITAPNDKTRPDFVPVYRKEIYDAIQREKAQQKTEAKQQNNQTG